MPKRDRHGNSGVGPRGLKVRRDGTFCRRFVPKSIVDADYAYDTQFYLIEWEGYDKRGRSWEPESSFTRFPELLKKFLSDAFDLPSNIADFCWNGTPEDMKSIRMKVAACLAQKRNIIPPFDLALEGFCSFRSKPVIERTHLERIYLVYEDDIAKLCVKQQHQAAMAAAQMGGGPPPMIAKAPGNSNYTPSTPQPQPTPSPATTVTVGTYGGPGQMPTPAVAAQGTDYIYEKGASDRADSLASDASTPWSIPASPGPLYIDTSSEPESSVQQPKTPTGHQSSFRSSPEPTIDNSPASTSRIQHPTPAGHQSSPVLLISPPPTKSRSGHRTQKGVGSKKQVTATRSNRKGPGKQLIRLNGKEKKLVGTTRPVTRLQAPLKLHVDYDPSLHDPQPRN